MTRCLKVLLATVGSRGDVQPMLALAQSLTEFGHIPTLAAPIDFESWITKQGFRFAPLGLDVQAYLSQNQNILTGNTLTMIRESTRFFKANMLPQAKQLHTACAGADCIVYAGLTLPIAPSVAQSRGLPALRVNYTSAMTPSDDHPPATVPWRGLPKWLNNFLWHTDRWLARRVLGSSIDAMRAELGLPPLLDFWGHMTHTFPAVNAFDKTVFPPSDRWGLNYKQANFLFFKDPMPLETELEQWLDEGAPPVYVGFGSMSGRGTDRIANIVIDAIQATGMRCLVGAGWAGLGSGAIPAGWRVVREAPHALLFPRMAVVVHHGGSGTVAQAMRAGAPQVVLPLILDQFHHAHKLYQAGIAPRPVSMEKITAPQLAAAIQAAMALPTEPIQAAASRLRSSDGCTDVVRIIETMVPL
ncbi:MAG: glycosyltransferase [Rhodoferax sp.]|nr:glycosyltransferase [Rhodoferax sp.]